MQTEEVLLRFTELVTATDGVRFAAQVCGRAAGDGRWEGWIEFLTPSGEAARSARETVQPNRTDLAYWASGLSLTYLEGALARARPLRDVVAPEPAVRPLFEGPAAPPTPMVSPEAPRAVLDPFAVYTQGESVLRRELSALSADHLMNIISAYGLDVSGASSDARGPVEGIVAAVRAISENG